MPPSKGGRPAIGTPVSVTLPEQVLDEVEEFARADGVTRSEELRLVVIQGLASRRAADRPASESENVAVGLSEELRPATDVLASWIGRDPDESRARFIRYRRTASYAKQLVQLLIDATRDAEAGVLAATLPPSSALIAKLSDPNDWRLRGQLFFEVVAELGNRGVVIHAGGDGDDDGEPEIVDEEEYA